MPCVDVKWMTMESVSHCASVPFGKPAANMCQWIVDETRSRACWSSSLPLLLAARMEPPHVFISPWLEDTNLESPLPTDCAGWRDKVEHVSPRHVGSQWQAPVLLLQAPALLQHVSLRQRKGGGMGGAPGADMPDLNALSRGLGAGGLGKGLGGLLGGGTPNGLPGLGGKPSGKKK